MDFLQFNPTYKVLICTSCECAIIKTAVESHLRNAHKGQLTVEERKECLRVVLTMDLEAPELVQQIDILPSSAPIPYLRLYSNGTACQLCESRPYVCCSEQSIREHLKKVHNWTSGTKGGRPSKASQVARAASGTTFSKVTTGPVACQTFYRSNFFRYFVVTPVKDEDPQSTSAT
jgi:hypothetical protein